METTKTEKPQRIVRAGRLYLWIACSHCDEVQCVDRGEDGGGAIVQDPCHECGEMLCENCRVICEFCGARHCAEHMKKTDAGNLCPVCRRIQEEVAICMSEERERVEGI